MVLRPGGWSISGGAGWRSIALLLWGTTVGVLGVRPLRAQEGMPVSVSPTVLERRFREHGQMLIGIARGLAGDDSSFFSLSFALSQVTKTLSTADKSQLGDTASLQQLRGVERTLASMAGLYLTEGLLALPSLIAASRTLERVLRQNRALPISSGGALVLGVRDPRSPLDDVLTGGVDTLRIWGVRLAQLRHNAYLELPESTESALKLEVRRHSDTLWIVQVPAGMLGRGPANACLDVVLGAQVAADGPRVSFPLCLQPDGLAARAEVRLRHERPDSLFRLLEPRPAWLSNNKCSVDGRRQSVDVAWPLGQGGQFRGVSAQVEESRGVDSVTVTVTDSVKGIVTLSVLLAPPLCLASSDGTPRSLYAHFWRGTVLARLLTPTFASTWASQWVEDVSLGRASINPACFDATGGGTPRELYATVTVQDRLQRVYARATAVAFGGAPSRGGEEGLAAQAPDWSVPMLFLSPRSPEDLATELGDRWCATLVLGSPTRR